MKINHNTDKLMDNLRIDEVQIYGAPADIHVVYLDYFTQFYDFHLDNVSVMKVLVSVYIYLSISSYDIHPQMSITWQAPGNTR